MIFKDLSNPQVLPYLNFYPEEKLGIILETWQCSRWKEFPLHLLTPMFARGTVRYYVNELTSLRSGKLVVPIMWFNRDSSMHARALEVVEMDVSLVRNLFALSLNFFQIFRKA